MILTCYLKKQDVHRFTYETFLFSQNWIHHRIGCNGNPTCKSVYFVVVVKSCIFSTVSGAAVKMWRITCYTIYPMIISQFSFYNKSMCIYLGRSSLCITLRFAVSSVVVLRPTMQCQTSPVFQWNERILLPGNTVKLLNVTWALNTRRSFYWLVIPVK